MKFEIIPTKAILYDKCENVEQLYDNFYYPLLVEYKELKKKYENAKNQLQQKENIIKEVREYITYWHYRNNFRINSFTTGVKEELLEILDKGSELIMSDDLKIAINIMQDYITKDSENVLLIFDNTEQLKKNMKRMIIENIQTKY